MTDPIELTVRGKDQVIAFACGTCHVVASSPKQYAGDDALSLAREAARLHCGPWFCACGSERSRFRERCDPCDKIERWNRDAERDADILAKAKRVTLDEYDGDMFYIDGRDKYVDRDELEDMRIDGDAPEYVFGCHKTKLELDAESILEDALSGHHEDAHEQLARGAESALQAALDHWAKRYAAGLVSYEPDYSVVVWLDDPKKGEGT